MMDIFVYISIYCQIIDIYFFYQQSDLFLIVMRTKHEIPSYIDYIYIDYFKKKYRL
jgi:hypothetical protein